jgi:hypothetical protein
LVGVLDVECLFRISYACKTTTQRELPRKEDRMSYIADEHRDWHTWNRVPMGPSGGSCPWDACGWADDYEDDYGDDLTASLRPGETYGDGNPWVRKGPLTLAESIAAEPPF